MAQNTRRPRATAPRSHLLAIKSLKASRRALLGTHRNSASLKHKSTMVSSLRGEPAKFASRISATASGRTAPTKWTRARTHHFKKRLAERKARRDSIGNWRRSRKVIRPR